ncbi:MAG TPA: PQQ-dependent sugar dehydrogenase [Chitinophagales bacterium]|nr:PQQ-dependent sugar dehydrogenase [Chitinophagales bacterium]
MSKACCYTIFIICLFFYTPIFSQQPVITLQEFSTGYSGPVDIQNCGDSRLFVVQQNGYIYLCDSMGVRNPTPFLDIHTKISQSSERGLLGLAFHPDYLNNGFFFVYYTRLTDGYLRISRFSADSLNANAADPNSELILIEIPHPSYNNHNGGCLQFGPDGYLYAGTGDGGSFGDPDENAQNTKNYLGKMLRIDIDNGVPYGIPADNPFINDPDNYYPEIWSYGLRNPWRFSFDRITGDLWIADVGQNTWEEIDFMPADNGGGQNYGWDCYEGTHTYEPVNCSGTAVLTAPVYEYQHSSGSNGDCSVTGGYIYRGGQFASLYGKYIFVDYCSGKFRATSQNSDGTFATTLVGDEVISQDEFSFSSFGQDHLGELYITDVTQGKIYKLKDTTCLPVAAILSSHNGITTIDTAVCVGTELQGVYGIGLTYQWQFNGIDIPGATSSSYLADNAGSYTLWVTNAENCTNSGSVIAGETTGTSFDGLDSIYCDNDNYQPYILSGNPLGGTFSGNGIAGDTFDPDIAGIGVHTITYTYENSFGCIASYSDSAIVVTCTGDNSMATSNSLQIFPVPCKGSFSITGNNTAEKITEVSIFNLSGQPIISFQVAPSTGNILTFNVQPVADGMYLLRITSGNNFFYKKLLIEN